MSKSVKKKILREYVRSKFNNDTAWGLEHSHMAHPIMALLYWRIRKILYENVLYKEKVNLE